jgi:hypothetical protein
MPTNQGTTIMPNVTRLAPASPPSRAFIANNAALIVGAREPARVVTAMSRGQSLHKHFTRSGPVYTLTDGQHVAADVAALVIADVRVVPVNDGLFPTTPQTWRWCL